MDDVALLEIVKENLHVTWDDEDARILEMISRGVGYLNGLAGVELDYGTPGLPRSLLFDWARYAYNNATEYFEENYGYEIKRMNLQAGVTKMLEDQTDEN